MRKDMELTDRDIDRIAERVVQKFIEHGRRRSAARFVASLSIEDMKREGGKIVSRFNSKRILGGASDER